MNISKVLLTSTLFIFYVFIFQDFLTAIGTINPAEALYPVFAVLPYILGIVLGICPIYFSLRKDDI